MNFFKKKDNKKKMSAALPITVNIIRGIDLPAKDANGFSDPYVTVHLKSQKKKSRQKTKVIDNNLNPVWNETFILMCEDPTTDALHINIYDKDIASDDLIGDKTIIPINELPVGELRNFEIDLHKHGKQEGKLCFTLLAGNLVPKADAPAGEPTPAAASSFAFDIHFVKASNLIKMDADKSDPYLKAYLKNVGKDACVKTNVVKNNLNPTWDVHRMITTNDLTDSIIIELWDEDIKYDDSMMDPIEIPIIDITPENPYHFDRDIQRKGSDAGHLEFHILAIDPKDFKNRDAEIGKCHFLWGSYSSSFSTSFSGYSHCSKSLDDILKDGDFDHIHLEVTPASKEKMSKPKSVHQVSGTIVSAENLVTLADDEISVYASVQYIGRSAIGKGKGDKDTTDHEHSASPTFNKEYDLKKGKKGDSINLVVYQKHSQQGTIRIGSARIPIKAYGEGPNEPVEIKLEKPRKVNDENAIEGKHESYGTVKISVNHKVEFVDRNQKKKKSSSSSDDEKKH